MHFDPIRAMEFAKLVVETLIPSHFQVLLITDLAVLIYEIYQVLIINKHYKYQNFTTLVSRT